MMHCRLPHSLNPIISETAGEPSPVTAQRHARFMPPFDCDTLATMSAVKAKICGIINLEDALAACEAGADYLGFIFWPPGKRSIAPTAAREITRELRQQNPAPQLVGVFVDESAQYVASILDQCDLDLAQLSGSEPPAHVGDPQSPLFGRSYKALRPTSLAEAQTDLEWYLPPQTSAGQPSLLLDAYHPHLPGGSGLRADWNLAAEIARDVPQLMLAGGLTPTNLAQAIEKVRPFAVDVASGVETAPGHKDHALVRAFIAAAHNA